MPPTGKISKLASDLAGLTGFLDEPRFDSLADAWDALTAEQAAAVSALSAATYPAAQQAAGVSALSAATHDGDGDSDD